MNTTASYSSEHSWTSVGRSRRGSLESELSIQGKETDYVRDTSDTDCSSADKVEFEPVTEPEDDDPLDWDSSGQSDNEIITTKVIEVSVGDDGDLEFADSEQTESEGSDSEMDLYDYWECAQCRAENNNPMYRYCEKCFKVRKNFFPPRPKRKNKRNRVTNVPRTSSVDSGFETNFTSQDLSQGTNPSQPSELSQGTNPSQPSELSQGTYPSQPSELSQGTYPSQSSELSQGTNPSQPSELSQGTNPSQPSELSQGTNLIQPSELSQGTNLSQPFELSQGQPFELSQGQPFELSQGQPFELSQGTNLSQPFELSQGTNLTQQSELSQNTVLSQPTDQSQTTRDNERNTQHEINKTLVRPYKRRAESADRNNKRMRIDYSDSDSDSDEPRRRKAKSADPEVAPLVKTVSDPALTIEEDSVKLTKKAIMNSLKEKFDNGNLCIICYAEPKSAVFVHGRIAHICCCYQCANKVWRKAKRCPQCNCKVSNVLKVL